MKGKRRGESGDDKTQIGSLVDRRFGLKLLLGGAASACVGRAFAADSLEQTAIQIGGVRDPQLGAQLAIAEKTGLFKAQGLDVTVHWTESATDIMSFLAGGAFYLATSSVNNQVLLKSKDIPVKTVAALCDGAGTQGIVLGPGVRLASPRDLAGKRFASPITSSHVMMLAKLGKQYNFDATKIKLVTMEPSDAVVAVVRGDVDGALTYDPFMHHMLQLGCSLYATGTTSYISGKRVVLPEDDQLLYQNALMLVDENWMAKNPNTIKAVLRAFIQATDIIKNDRARATGILHDFLHVDAPTMDAIMTDNRYSMALDDGILRSINFASDWLLKVKRISAAVAPESVLAPNLLREVDSRLVAIKA